MKSELAPDPGPAHPDDLRRVLVIRTPPHPRMGLVPEAFFTPGDGRYIAGSFRIPGGRRFAVAVDPEIEAGTFRVEDALTGEVVRTGEMGRIHDRLPASLPRQVGKSPLRR